MTDRPATTRADSDPMLYDIMRETATELRGEYVWLSNHADTAADRDASTAAHIALWQDVNSVRGSEVATITAKTEEYRARLRALRAGSDMGALREPGS